MKLLNEIRHEMANLPKGSGRKLKCATGNCWAIVNSHGEEGVAIAARQYGVRAVVCMAENATPSKIA